jgi:uncharacterized protein (TIGR04141 family)
MQHLTLFLLKRCVKKFEDAVRVAEAGNPITLTNQSFAGVLYLPTPPVNSPSWLPFLQSGFPGQNVDANRMASALVLLKAKNRIFAVTFGHARHLLEPDSFERDFGLRVVVNSVSTDKIRGISLRMFKEPSVKRQEEAAKGTALRTFGIDIQQDLLRGVTGVPENTSLASRLSGSDSLTIDVALEFGALEHKCIELLAAYNGKDYVTREFDWIDNLKVVRSPSEVEKLDKRLVAELKKKDPSIQMLYPDTLNREVIQGFLYHREEDDAEKHTELDVASWKSAFRGKLSKLTIDELRVRRIAAFDGDGAKLASFPDRDCFVFETNLKGKRFIMSNGEWYEVATNFDNQITKYIDSISETTVNLPDYSKEWDGKVVPMGLKSGEDRYLEEAAKRCTDIINMHTINSQIGGSHVEACDLLHISGKLIHVKIWKQSATFSHLLSQGAISAESLLRDSGYRERVATSPKQHTKKLSKLFPQDGFAPSKLCVVLALVRESAKPLPFFSRLNLMREGQRIERLGYRVRYQRIAIK